jgi:hypothetical protein
MKAQIPFIMRGVPGSVHVELVEVNDLHSLRSDASPVPSPGIEARRCRMDFRPASRDELTDDDPPADYFVWWDDIDGNDVRAYEERLETASNEADLQRYLVHPLMLIQQLGGGHGRYVVPKQRLGSEYVTDFVIGERSSLGFEWIAVELESPTAQMFTKNGDASARLNHAIRQISDCRARLQRNQDYAARARQINGLGLTDIDPRHHGLIVIGRESEHDPRSNELRRQLAGGSSNPNSHLRLDSSSRGRSRCCARTFEDTRPLGRTETD